MTDVERYVSTGTTRVGDPERERVVGLLSSAFGKGYLSKEELDDRLDRCQEAITQKDIYSLVSDLPDYRVAPHKSKSAIKRRRLTYMLSIAAGGIIAIPGSVGVYVASVSTKAVVPFTILCVFLGLAIVGLTIGLWVNWEKEINLCVR